MQKYTELFFKFAIVLSLGVFLFSHTVSATEISGKCSQKGYTIATINGVFTNEVDAKKNMYALVDRVGEIQQGEKIDYQYLLNPSHLGGIGDILKSAYQGIFDKETVNDYDLTEIIKDASEKVRTQKLLLVAHSQGNFYANSFYDSVAGKSGGVPTESIGVYSVATPASRVAGGGKWLTSDTDKVIAGVVGRVPFKSIMAPNTHIELSDGDDELGHNFTDIYLKYRAGQIVSDIESSLNNLKNNNSQDDNESCIAPPKITVVHKIESAMFAVADPVANVGVSAVSNTVSGTYYAGKAVASIVQKAAQTTTAAIGDAMQNVKNLFSKSKISQSAAIADIGQAVEIGYSERSEGSQETDSSSTDQSDTEEAAQNTDSSVASLPQNNDQVEIASSAPLPRNDEPIHAPYQWPEESSHGSPSINSGTDSGIIANQNQIQQASAVVNDGKPAFVGAGGSDVVVVENNPEIARPNDIQSGVASPLVELEARNDNALDTLADTPFVIPDAPSVIPVETGIQTQEESQLELPQQPTTPDIQFYLTNYSVRSQDFTLNWRDDNNVVQNWELQYKLGPNFEWGILKQVQDDGDTGSPSINSGHNHDFTAQYDDLTYYFRLRGQDAGGNPTDWKTLQADISTKPIVINEIAWRGTGASPYDEWIELANKTGQEIDLNGWILKTNDANINANLSGKIAPNGFYLLERTDDTTISNIAADQTYTGALRDAQGQYDRGDMIYLIDGNGNTIDQTQVALSGQGYLERRSSERISVWSPGLYLNNWEVYQGSGDSSALDADGNIIYGTPRNLNSQANKYLALNSGVFEAPPQITKDTIFLKDRGPYMVNGSIGIMGVKVYAEPGTKFEFSSFGFIGFHDGAELVAKGTENEKIYIKSSNSAGIALYFSNGANGELDNVEIEGGMVRTNASTIKISNSLFKNGSYGFLDLLNGSEVDISNSEFNGNNYGDAIVIKQSQGKIYGNNIKNNRGNGIYIDSLSGVLNISGNSFSGNSYPIATDGFIDFDLSGNIFDNGVYELLVYNPVVDSGEVATISNKMSYILYDRAKDSDWYKVGDPEVKAGGVLKIEPGAIVKFDSNSLLKLNGRLESMGTPENPIVLKYMWDYASYEDMKSSVVGEIDNSKYVQFGEGSEYAIENIITRESGDNGYQSYWLVK